MPYSTDDDLLAAFSDNKGKVSLMFNHACAAVRFYVRKSVDKPVIITSVMTYTLTNASIGLTTEKQLLPCGYLFIIPQTKEGLTLKVSYTVNGDEKTHDFNFSGEWKAGHSYVVNVNMGTNVINAQ